MALYEAVYGERPFGEGSVEHRVAAVIDGTLGGTEAGAPPRLRRVLARGLAAQPEERWPSMDALLEQLGRLVAPRARRWAWLSLGVGVLGVGGGLALGQLAMQRERCGDPLLRLTNIWDDGRRQEVKAAILGTELSFAPGTWQRVERRLDDYASAWASKHGEVCEASTEDAQGGADRRLRLDCIHERSRALRAAVDIMARADAEVVKNAVELVTDLPGLDRCDDLVALRALVPPPEDADARQRVEAIREVLADISAQEKVGRYAAALEDVEPVVERAEVLGYGPLVAETKALRGLLRDGDGRYADAEQDLLDAFETAMAHRHDEVAMQTARQLAFVIGYRQARHAEGGQWSRVARALAKRNGSDAELAGSLQGLGVLLYHQGHHEQAQRHHEQALRMTERIRGPRHPQVARILNNLAVALDARGEHEQAQLHYERALRIWEEVLGAGHPISGGILTNLGVALYAQKKYEQARLAHERAVQLRAEALGTDHPSVALSLTNLGFVLQAQDDHQQARVELGRALRIMETSLDAEHPNLAYPLCGLAKSALAQDDFESARTYAERAVAIRESSGVAPELLAEARMFLARVLWYYPAQRPRARALAEQAREVWVAGDRGLDDQRAEVEDWLANHPL